MSTLGITQTVIATEIVKAVAADETPENGGCDISAGMFGPALSQWIREIAKHIDDTNTALRAAVDKVTWVPTSERLPTDETPVLIVWRGNVVIGERRWENPGPEDTYAAFWYWDDPSDDGQDWRTEDVTHWMHLPELPDSSRIRPEAKGKAA